jgi:hypothetical protein
MIEGTRRVGGVGIVIERFVQGDRLEFFEYFYEILIKSPEFETFY